MPPRRPARELLENAAPRASSASSQPFPGHPAAAGRRERGGATRSGLRGAVAWALFVAAIAGPGLPSAARSEPTSREAEVGDATHGGTVDDFAEVSSEASDEASDAVPDVVSDVVSDEAATEDAAEALRSYAADARHSPPPPVGVRFGEALEDEHLRIAYSWERLKSQGLRAGTNNITPDYARAKPPAGLGFLRTPRSLEVTVHTIQLAYAPHPRVTLVAELPILQKELEIVDSFGTRSQLQTDGIGDVGFAVVIPFIRKGRESSQVHVGFDAPSGSIRRGGDVQRLPYDSQLGNGTVDFEWGWTYRGHYEWLSWGGQAVGRHPLGRNGLKYREGSHFVGTLWGAFRLLGGLSTSVRAQWEKQNNIEGFDRSLRESENPSENSKLRGSERITLYSGLSLDIPGLGHQRLALEFGIPVYQRVDGPQLERDWSVKTAWQWVY